jgi:signal transduction histidine kinase
MDKQFIFYTVKLIAIIPAVVITYFVLKRKPPFATLVANGLMCTIAGTCITVCMIILRNNGVHHLFTDGYPLFFIRLGILGDMIFYMVAILKKWHFLEKELLKEKLESQLAAEQLRNKISGELHDDLGSTLSGISMYSYMTSDLLQSGEYEKAKRSLHVIQKSANEMALNLDDLVWSINPRQDSFETLIERMEQYATEICAAKGISFKACYNGIGPDKILSMEARHHIYLFLKEAINNAVKYSQATTLSLVVKEENGELIFSVIDDGKGFDRETVKNGNGLANMHKRAGEIGAIVAFQSQKNEGTSVSLKCKIT